MNHHMRSGFLNQHGLKPLYVVTSRGQESHRSFVQRFCLPYVCVLLRMHTASVASVSCICVAIYFSREQFASEFGARARTGLVPVSR